jgi:hypothetical protein
MTSILVHRVAASEIETLDIAAWRTQLLNRARDG